MANSTMGGVQAKCPGWGRAMAGTAMRVVLLPVGGTDDTPCFLYPAGRRGEKVPRKRQKGVPGWNLLKPLVFSIKPQPAAADGGCPLDRGDGKGASLLIP